jgi:putative peptidoglycan lipid II flippase
VRLDLREMGLRPVARMAGWSTVYVMATGAGFLVLTRLATAVDQLPEYVTAFTVWQLPHAVIAVSVITALLPRMSGHAVENRLDLVRADLDQGLRLVTLTVWPMALALIVLGRPVAAALFAHGITSYQETQRIGAVLATLAVGLVSFSRLQVQARAFYALGDTRTPALIQVFASSVLITVDLLATAVLADPWRVYGLASGLVVSHCAGSVTSTLVLGRRLPAPVGPRPSRSTRGLSLPTALIAAGLVASAGWAACAWILAATIPPAWHDTWYGAALVVAVAVPVGLGLYVVTLLLAGVGEAQTALAAVRARLRGEAADRRSHM